ncbi:MAG TPA: hypothetical protein VIL85_01965 [Thermomicrobiales bacterium]|jgi:hypothetical protein
MKRTATIVQAIMGLCGIAQITMGILFWTGNALDFVNLHMFLGLAIVLLLWTLAALGLRAGVPIGLAGLAFVWGLIVPAIGMAQAQILPGSLHWIVQVIHLLLGIVALGLGDTLARRNKATHTSLSTQATTQLGSVR